MVLTWQINVGWSFPQLRANPHLPIYLPAEFTLEKKPLFSCLPLHTELGKCHPPPSPKYKLQPLSCYNLWIRKDSLTKKNGQTPAPSLGALFPWGSMYGLFAYIYHKNQPNVGKYTIHGSSGFERKTYHLYHFIIFLDLLFPVVGTYDSTIP